MKTIKKLIFTAVVFFCIFGMGNQCVFALENTDIFSNEAIVVNLNTNEILFTKNTKEESVPIASLTKVMTYVVAIENIQDIVNTKIIVPEGTKQDIINKNGSNAGLEDGYEYTALDLLYGLMLPSGCDAADVLAKHISNNDYPKFVEMMNKKALELDMNDTIFYNASGLEEDGKENLSTEQDLYKLAKYAFDLPYFKQIIGTEFYEINGTKEELHDENMVRNTNYMMGEYNGAEYYYQYSLGGKTGNTSGAGRCLISFARKGDLELVTITLGVPNQHSNYHLTDHKKLFEYVFDTYSENVTVDIGSEYKSVGIGEKIQIIPTTSKETTVNWKSSDESVATVNKYGVVTGKKLGQVKITATTSTGNQDYAYVSVGFYNGIDVKYSSGPNDSNGILGYGKIDWGVFKDYGIDFAIIRAGYALNNKPDSDPYFVTNIKGAIDNNINIMISFDGYASNAEHAENEAEYLIKYLDDNISEYLDEIKLPIVYNLFKSDVTDPETLEEVIFAFKNKMKESGYDIIVELGKSLLEKLDLETITNSDMGLYIIWRPYVPDFTTQMSALKGENRFYADLWSYRTDAYFGDTGVAKKTIMSVMYMDSQNINTSHEKYDDALYPDKPEIEVKKDYIYTGKNIEALVSGFDHNTMEIEGNIEKNAGTYTITIKPKIKWKDGSKDSISTTWKIEKADPEIKLPELEAENGKLLSDIKLPENFCWKNSKEKVDINKTNKFLATYIPKDTNNYNTIDVELIIKILSEDINIDNDNMQENDKEQVSNKEENDKDENNNKVEENKDKINNKVENNNKTDNNNEEQVENEQENDILNSDSIQIENVLDNNINAIEKDENNIGKEEHIAASTTNVREDKEKNKKIPLILGIIALVAIGTLIILRKRNKK